MKTLLFIRNNPFNVPYGGSRGTEKAYRALSQKYILIDYFVNKRSNGLLTFFRNMLLYSGNLSWYDEFKIMNLIKGNTRIDIVFFDVSLHGRLVKRIKMKYPQIKIIVNFHNNENKYFYDLVISSGIKYVPIWLSAKYNENLSLKFSDLNIFITEKDKKSINKSMKPSIIIPVTLNDIYIQKNVVSFQEYPYLLFIGSAFFGNISAVSTIINKIAPVIPYKIIIVGKGMSAIFSSKSISKNVEIKDYVEDLSELYEKASAFIAPINYGSGMKVKIAEALMYGKKILASSNTLSGYKKDITSIIECNTLEDFISEINKLNIQQTFYQESRQLFLEYYSSLKNELYYSQIDKFVL
jgi:glycosyltransferase involved in cell wall biosynthesis